MSAESGLESSFLTLAAPSSGILNYTVPLSKEDALVCPVFLLQVYHVFQGERVSTLLFL